MEPVSTTGFAAVRSLVPSVKLKKNAVSSIVSVPCIITKPSTFSCDVPTPTDANSLILRTSAIQISEVISSELILQTCSTKIFATVFNSGTASINACASSAPDLYPIDFPGSPAPAIVPPVAKITIFFIAPTPAVPLTLFQNTFAKLRPSLACGGLADTWQTYGRHLRHPAKACSQPCEANTNKVLSPLPY